MAQGGDGGNLEHMCPVEADTRSWNPAGWSPTGEQAHGSQTCPIF